MRRYGTILALAVLTVASAPALAQSGQGNMSGMNMQNMQGMSMQGMGNMMGSHMMQATVTAIDTATGLVDVTSGGMALKLHFPPASLANVKPGDSITLHLGFTKP
jgi:hypothetical protein